MKMFWVIFDSLSLILFCTVNFVWVIFFRWSLSFHFLCEFCKLDNIRVFLQICQVGFNCSKCNVEDSFCICCISSVMVVKNNTVGGVAWTVVVVYFHYQLLRGERYKLRIAFFQRYLSDLIIVWKCLTKSQFLACSIYLGILANLIAKNTFLWKY